MHELRLPPVGPVVRLGLRRCPAQLSKVPTMSTLTAYGFLAALVAFMILAAELRRWRSGAKRFDPWEQFYADARKKGKKRGTSQDH